MLYTQTLKSRVHFCGDVNAEQKKSSFLHK